MRTNYITFFIKRPLLPSSQDFGTIISSIESYLERYNHNFNYDALEKKFTIDVNDRNDAIRLKMELKLDEVFFISEKGMERIEDSPVFRNTSQFFIDGERVTSKKIFKSRAGNLSIQYISKSQVVSQKILSKGALEKAISDHKLSPVRRGSHTLINREELAVFLNLGVSKN